MKLLNFILFFCASLLCAQSVSDFKYVVVPKKFADFKTNNAYNLNRILESKLTDRNYIVVSDEKESWPEELLSDPCQALNADLKDTSTLFKNKIKLVLTDCSGASILVADAVGDYKEFDKGFQDALLKGVVQVQPSQGIMRKAVVQKTIPQQVDKEVATVSSKINPNRISKTDTNPGKSVMPLENSPQVNKMPSTLHYTYQGRTFNRVNLAGDYFILTTPDSSQPFATFKESSKEGVFHVQLVGNSVALGVQQENGILVESWDAAASKITTMFFLKSNN